MQFIKPISLSGGFPTLLPPIILVVGLSSVKDYIEDRKRKKSDEAENNSKTLVGNINTKKFEETKWKYVVVG